ncbi:hypothetical protein BGZ83_011435 [Gryganskiella cystojenkinii]|nr:hypothetical protein BGZ83_011435 [Gryganskiella cystojenkinii]
MSDQNGQQDSATAEAAAAVTAALPPAGQPMQLVPPIPFGFSFNHCEIPPIVNIVLDYRKGAPGGSWRLLKDLPPSAPFALNREKDTFMVLMARIQGFLSKLEGVVKRSDGGPYLQPSHNTYQKNFVLLNEHNMLTEFESTWRKEARRLTNPSGDQVFLHLYLYLRDTHDLKADADAAANMESMAMSPSPVQNNHVSSSSSSGGRPKTQPHISHTHYGSSIGGGGSSSHHHHHQRSGHRLRSPSIPRILAGSSSGHSHSHNLRHGSSSSGVGRSSFMPTTSRHVTESNAIRKSITPSSSTISAFVAAAAISTITGAGGSSSSSPSSLVQTTSTTTARNGRVTLVYGIRQPTQERIIEALQVQDIAADEGVIPWPGPLVKGELARHMASASRMPEPDEVEIPDTNRFQQLQRLDDENRAEEEEKSRQRDIESAREEQEKMRLLELAVAQQHQQEVDEVADSSTMFDSDARRPVYIEGEEFVPMRIRVQGAILQIEVSMESLRAAFPNGVPPSDADGFSNNSSHGHHNGLHDDHETQDHGLHRIEHDARNQSVEMDY